MAIMKVQYVGTSGIRHIAAKDLEDLGITVSAESAPVLIVRELAGHGIQCEPDDLVWHRYNKWSLTMDVSERLEDILRGEGVFTLSKVRKGGVPEVEAVALDPSADSEAATVVDKTTGAKSAGKRSRS